MSAWNDPESDALHARSRAFVRAFERGESPPESFDALAVDLARFQASRVPGLRRLARSRGRDLASVSRASEVPAVPTDAFKHTRLATFPEEATVQVFRTSGTTLGSEARGLHAFRELGTYDLGAVAFGRHALFAGLEGPPAVVVLAPPIEQASDSSLGHMMSTFVRELCHSAPAERSHFVEGASVDVGALRSRLDALGRGTRPVLVLGTSFAYVHLLDALQDARFSLPAGSRLMQTGGFKGKSREVPADELRASLAHTFGLLESHVVCEYGMTELSSQFYERTLLDPSAPHGEYVEPPWARVVPVDPETLEPVSPGQIGLARIEDLGNVDSAFAVQTQDRVVRVEQGFRLLGRAPGAPPRGCSLAIDELLSGGAA